MKYAIVRPAGRFCFTHSVHPFNPVGGRNRLAPDVIGRKNPRKVSPTLIPQRFFEQKRIKRGKGGWNRL